MRITQTPAPTSSTHTSIFSLMVKPIAFVAGCVALFSGLSLANNPNTADLQPKCHISETNDCNASKIREPTLIYPGGKTHCVWNDNKSQYFYRVVPGSEENRNKVLLYFQPGGACFGDFSCSKGAARLMKLLRSFQIYWKYSAMADPQGVMNHNDPANPFKGWTILEIPVCTGDANTGRRVVVPWFEKVHHNGASNTEAVLNWVYKNIKDPTRVVVAGFSSGALSAQVWLNRIVRDLNSQGKYPEISMISDSFNGALPEKQIGRIVKRWGTCGVDLAWDKTLQQKCVDGKFDLSEYMMNTIQRNPKVSFAFTYSRHDVAEVAFYCLTKWGFVPWVLFCLKWGGPKVLPGRVQSIFQKYHQVASGNVATYGIEGADHGILQTHYFEHANVDGEPIKQWIGRVSSDFNDQAIPSHCEGECPKFYKEVRIKMSP